MRFALRFLLKTPGFTITALATLAICLGANLTIFAVVDAILIRPLPFPDAERLVTLYYTYPKLDTARSGASLTTYYERRGQIPALASLAAISQATSVVGEAGTTSIENLGRVTSEFFSTLGVEPFMGRAFKDEELTYQTDHVAMLSHEYWLSHFHADPAILGKSIRLDGIDRVIVGVLPPDFRFLSFQAPVYMPLSSEDGERNIFARHALGTVQIGRIAPGATLADVQAQIDANDALHAPEFPQAQIVADAGCHTVVASLHADHVAAVRPTLLLLQAGALCLLLIGGVNLVNLLLIRASGRSRELAIRQALGASQRHVAWDVMTESIVLTVAGALLGLLVGSFGIQLLASFGAKELPLGAQIAFDARIAVVALVSAVVAGGVIGLPIIWFNLRGRLAAALQSESRGSTIGRATQRLRHAFIVAQVALAFVLLTGATLLAVSLERVMQVAPGFQPEHVITGRFNLTWNGYNNLPSFRTFFDRLDEQARAVPGISAVGVVSNVPVNPGGNNDAFSIPGHLAQPGEAASIHNWYGVAGDYFAAMGIPVHEGRALDQADTTRDQLVCVVDQNFARRYWPDGDAVGQSVYRGLTIDVDERPFTVVGVVGAVKQDELTERTSSGAIYFPYSQVFNRTFFLVARTHLPPESIGVTLTKVVRTVDPDVPLTDLRTMEVRISDSLATRRSPALLAGVFASTALLLATIGLYGVMAYTVTQRTSEFGIRLALGAQRHQLLRLVLGQGARLIVLGLTLGLGGALALTGVLASQLFGIQANDPLALTGVGLVLTVVAGLACFLPAHRATKVDPLVALRAD